MHDSSQLRRLIALIDDTDGATPMEYALLGSLASVVLIITALALLQS